MRRGQTGAVAGWIPLAVVIVLLAVGAGIMLRGDSNAPRDDGDGNEVAEGSPSPDDGVAPTFSPLERLPNKQLFARGMIEQRVVLDHEGDKEIRVFFVNPDVTSDPNRATTRCVESFLKGKKFYAATCYGFASMAAFEASDVDPDSGKMAKECWTGYFLKTTNTPGRGAFVNVRYEDEGCPPVDEEAAAG